MINADFGKVIKIIEEEIEIFENLRRLTQRKSRVIIDRKIDELENITIEETTYALRIGGIEEQREKELIRLSKELNIARDDINISNLSKFAGEEMTRKIEELGNDLKGILLDIKGINELNEGLINHSMEYVDFLLNLVTNISNSADNNYSNDGKLSESGTPKRLFDVKL